MNGSGSGIDQNVVPQAERKWKINLMRLEPEAPKKIRRYKKTRR
jgi:hypothetical protein